MSEETRGGRHQKRGWGPTLSQAVMESRTGHGESSREQENTLGNLASHFPRKLEDEKKSPEHAREKGQH